MNFDAFEVLTFDCYGTLIDWEAGIWAALRPVLADHHIDMPADQTLELHAELESEAERGEYRPHIGKCPDWITGIHGDDPVRLYSELCEVVEDVIRHFEAEGRPLPSPRIRPMQEVA